jgi:hypothetical protein
VTQPQDEPAAKQQAPDAQQDRDDPWAGFPTEPALRHVGHDESDDDDEYDELA